MFQNIIFCHGLGPKVNKCKWKSKIKNQNKRQTTPKYMLIFSMTMAIKKHLLMMLFFIENNK